MKGIDRSFRLKFYNALMQAVSINSFLSIFVIAVKIKMSVKLDLVAYDHYLPRLEQSIKVVIKLSKKAI